MTQSVRDTKKRVKVYSYTENGLWDDMGTGYVTIDFMERNNAFTVIVRSEDDGSVLLESKILQDRGYQKREETLIVWTEDDSCDLAVSFQEKVGCDEMWEEMCEIQGRSPEVAATQALSEDGELSDWFDESSVLQEVDLPPCELSRLEDLHDLIEKAMSNKSVSDIISHGIEKEDYVSKLLDIFRVCEDLDNAEGLKFLHKIFTGLLLLNKNDLLTAMIQDNTIMNVIGCLEYSPCFPHVRHRDIVQRMSERREIIPFSDPTVLPKIHKTYQIQYIRDVLLPTPSLFEEHKFAVLNSYLLMNKSEIVQSIQQDTDFLESLFKELTEESTTAERYRELAELLREVNNFALVAKLPKNKLYTWSGFMKAIEGMLSSEDSVVVPLAIDILQSVTSYNCSITWDHILQTAKSSSSEDTHLLNIVISLLVDGEFAENDVQLVGLIQSIITPDNLGSEADGETEAATTEAATTASATAVEKSLFLKNFYSHSIHRLMAPLMAQTASNKISKDTGTNAVLLSHILDILSECIERHSYPIRNYIINKNLLARVLVLMTSSHGHLVLSALRFCRRIVGLKDDFFNRYVIRNNLFSPIVKTMIANGQRYNLVNSAIIELFKFITMEKVTCLIIYTVDNFMAALDNVEYVDTFKRLKLAYDQERDRLENPSPASTVKESGGIHVNRGLLRWRKDPRALDEDEEAWFDDEEESVVTTTPTTSLPNSQPLLVPKPHPLPTPPFTHLSYSPRPSEENKPPPGHYTRPPLMSDSQIKIQPVTSSPALMILATDYDEDSDEESDSDDTASPAKRLKL